MKDCTRIDTEQALSLARNPSLNTTPRTRVVSSTSAGDEIAAELSENWSANTAGAELRCTLDDITATVSISKNTENNTYGYSLRLDSSQVGKGNSLYTIDECVSELESAINLVSQLCDNLNEQLDSNSQHEGEEN